MDRVIFGMTTCPLGGVTPRRGEVIPTLSSIMWSVAHNIVIAIIRWSIDYLSQTITTL